MSEQNETVTTATTVTTDPTQAAQPVEVAPSEANTTDRADSHDDTDVASALERETHDGRGDEDVPESDFQSYATDGVERSN